MHLFNEKASNFPFLLLNLFNELSRERERLDERSKKALYVNAEILNYTVLLLHLKSKNILLSFLFPPKCVI